MHLSLNHAEPERFHRQLAYFNVRRLALAQPSPDWMNDLETEHMFKIAEGDYLEKLRASVQPLLPRTFLDVDTFVTWFESLIHTGPGQKHPLFDWLATEASYLQMRWYLTQEAAGEAGFEDLVALTQVKLPAQAKLECARNYWDEMGHGRQAAMHGQMLDCMVRELDLRPEIDKTVWESLALSNTMVGLAATRRYAYHSLGALGAIELTAPLRVGRVSLGMRRHGMNGRMRAYFDVHAALDVSHAKAWIREVIRPLVTADMRCAVSIAEGALMRLVCGERTYDRYSVELQIDRRHPLAPLAVPMRAVQRDAQTADMLV